MLDFTPGHKYKFLLTDGRTITLKFKGLGPHMRQVWIDPESGSEIDPLPPFVSYQPA